MQTDYSYPSFLGAWEELFNAGDNNVYALPGSDVNLTCQTMEKDLMVQMQWSKVTDEIDMIVVYHPQYGFHYMQGVACESRVAAVETLKDATKWTLNLRNISSSLSGKYECSFTMYPTGTKTIVYNLIVEPCKYNLPKEGLSCTFHSFRKYTKTTGTF